MEKEHSAEYFMQQAIQEGEKAEAIGEVPIGAVIVKDGVIVGRGHNLRETTQQATTHAEMAAIQMANRTLANWRLIDCDLYVTVEPCPMCAGAIVLSRIRHVYYGTADPKAGACGSLMNLVQDERLNHQTELTAGVLEEECAQQMKDFFRALRAKRKQQSRKPRDGMPIDTTP
ncbi:MAG: tRNA adenosine(34) deaminase TadA [Aerococcus sp.]|nr:tRNA adenosine(34) deaminase TadA [Aerococcus sp.]